MKSSHFERRLQTYEAIEIALYHNLGALPEPEFTHKLW